MRLAVKENEAADPVQVRVLRAQAVVLYAYAVAYLVLMTDAMGGHVPLAIGAVSSVQAAVRSGRVRMLGVTSHSAAFPDAPNISMDVPGYDADTWFGLFAPRATPRDLVLRIRDDIAAVLQISDVRQRLLDIGGNPSGEPVDEFAARVRNEIDKWKKSLLPLASSRSNYSALRPAALISGHHLSTSALW